MKDFVLKKISESLWEVSGGGGWGFLKLHSWIFVEVLSKKNRKVFVLLIERLKRILMAAISV